LTGETRHSEEIRAIAPALTHRAPAQFSTRGPLPADPSTAKPPSNLTMPIDG
jgi:4-hydroxy-L-threonine phosphate dehydrogenase PdxA